MEFFLFSPNFLILILTLDAGEYITITVDDEEYRFSYSDKNNGTKEILKNANQGDYVEIEIKGGKPVDIRYAEQR